MASPQAAAQAIKNFRLREIRDLPRHLKSYGALTTPSPLAAEAGSDAIKLPNPFIPWENTKKGHWVNPKYSLRVQADLVKKAKATGTLHLLPPGPKLPASVLKQAIEKFHAQETARLEEEEEKVRKAEARKLQKAKAKAKEAILTPVVEVKNAEPETTVEGTEATEGVKAAEPVETAEEVVEAIAEAVEASEAEAVEAAAAAEAAEQAEKKELLESVWRQPVAWHGRLVEKKVAGTESGTRLYAGKRRMFKGHKWERVKAKRDIRLKILMRDMASRISKYKNYYKKRKPNPLKPSRSSKSPKLPF